MIHDRRIRYARACGASRRLALLLTQDERTWRLAKALRRALGGGAYRFGGENAEGRGDRAGRAAMKVAEDVSPDQWEGYLAATLQNVSTAKATVHQTALVADRIDAGDLRGREALAWQSGLALAVAGLVQLAAHPYLRAGRVPESHLMEVN